VSVEKVLPDCLYIGPIKAKSVLVILESALFNFLIKYEILVSDSLLFYFFIVFCLLRNKNLTHNTLLFLMLIGFSFCLFIQMLCFCAAQHLI